MYPDRKEEYTMEKYKAPAIEIVAFESEDVIKTSGGTGDYLDPDRD